MRNHNSSIDEIIQQAMDRGDFENLPGKGKPLKLKKNPYEDPEWGMAYSMIKSSGFTLPWMEKGKEIEADLEIARQELARTFQWMQRYANKTSSENETEWLRAKTLFKNRIDELNQKIKNYNLAVPSTQFQVKMRNYEYEINRIMAVET